MAAVMQERHWPATQIRSTAIQNFNPKLGCVIYGTHLGENRSPIDTLSHRGPSPVVPNGGGYSGI